MLTFCQSSPKCFLAIDNEAKKMYGVQFHPEVDLTKSGTQMFKNFLFNVSYRLFSSKSFTAVAYN